MRHSHLVNTPLLVNNKQYFKQQCYNKCENFKFYKETWLSTKRSSVETPESTTGWHFLLPRMASIAERSKEKDSEQRIQESVRW